MFMIVVRGAGLLWIGLELGIGWKVWALSWLSPFAYMYNLVILATQGMMTM